MHPSNTSERNPRALMSIWKAVMVVSSPATLKSISPEYHISQVTTTATAEAIFFSMILTQRVLRPQDVREHREPPVRFQDEPHGDAGHRPGDGHARVHHRKAAAADRGHGAGPVALRDVALDAHHVREGAVGGHDRGQGALSQLAMAQLTAACGGAERW